MKKNTFERAVNQELKKLLMQRALIDYKILLKNRELYKLEKKHNYSLGV
jgi:hypothetical protein